jgi:hypothetical protein
MVASGSASKFHVAAAKTKPSESRTIAPTPHLLSTGPDASMFNLKENVGGGVHVEGGDIDSLLHINMSIHKSFVIFNDIPSFSDNIHRFKISSFKTNFVTSIPKFITKHKTYTITLEGALEKIFLRIKETLDFNPNFDGQSTYISINNLSFVLF